MVGSFGGLEQIGIDIVVEFLLYWLYCLVLVGVLLWVQGMDFVGVIGEDVLVGVVVEVFGFEVYLYGDFVYDLLQFFVDVCWKVVLEFCVGDYYVVYQVVVGFGEIFLYFVDFLVFVV